MIITNININNNISITKSNPLSSSSKSSYTTSFAVGGHLSLKRNQQEQNIVDDDEENGTEGESKMKMIINNDDENKDVDVDVEDNDELWKLSLLPRNKLSRNNNNQRFESSSIYQDKFYGNHIYNRKNNQKINHHDNKHYLKSSVSKLSSERQLSTYDVTLYISLIISVCLLSTILMIQFHLRQYEPIETFFIIRNLVIALLFIQLTFLFGTTLHMDLFWIRVAQFSPSSLEDSEFFINLKHVLCLAVPIFLHFIHLASLFWMLSHTIMLYQRFWNKTPAIICTDDENVKDNDAIDVDINDYKTCGVVNKNSSALHYQQQPQHKSLTKQQMLSSSSLSYSINLNSLLCSTSKENRKRYLQRQSAKLSRSGTNNNSNDNRKHQYQYNNYDIKLSWISCCSILIYPFQKFSNYFIKSLLKRLMMIQKTPTSIMTTATTNKLKKTENNNNIININTKLQQQEQHLQMNDFNTIGTIGLLSKNISFKRQEQNKKKEKYQHKKSSTTMLTRNKKNNKNVDNNNNNGKNPIIINNNKQQKQNNSNIIKRLLLQVFPSINDCCNRFFGLSSFLSPVNNINSRSKNNNYNNNSKINSSAITDINTATCINSWKCIHYLILSMGLPFVLVLLSYLLNSKGYETRR